MFDFFRKYQWYFFFVITIFVIISFSFFGTYSAMNSGSWKEQVAFTAVDGSEVTRAEEEDMANFLATDNEDRSLYGVWGFNFLNDGVIRQDFLQTGLAQELVQAYPSELQDDLQKRLAKEKRYKLYTHPQAQFLSVENAWSYFFPEMSDYFQTIQKASIATDPNALDARVKLFLAEKKFPSPTLRQVLRYQEKQYNWLTPDPDLNRVDLSLFGYHTLEDWFGPRFIHLVSQFIINAAALAEDKGYEVSNTEVMADLIRNTEISYRQNKNDPNLGVTSPEEYFNEQLRRLNMDQSRAVAVWRQVMLFRRYFHDVGNASLVDTLVYQKFNEFNNQAVTIDLYRLPAELRIADYATLQKFEVYLNAIAKRPKEPLALPTTFLSAAEVAKTYPELVQKRYLLEIAQVNKKSLQARIGIKETWNWELEDKNWAALKKQFPDLGVKKDGTREERLAALDQLDTTTRSKVDAYARAAIVDKHSEWLNKALDDAQPQISAVGLRSQGGNTPFTGLKTKEQREKLIASLDKAPLNQSPSSDSSLNAFTADQQTYYRIKVIERDAEPSLLTFAEANADGSLDQLRDRVLEKHYTTIREKEPAKYQKEDQSWKSFDSVRDSVADQYFDSTLKALKPIQKKLFGNDTSKDQAASLRFYSHLQQTKDKIEKDPAQATQFVRAPQESSQNQLLKRPSLADQWLLERTDYQVERNKPEEFLDVAEAFTLPKQTWSAIKTPANGDLAFYQVKEQGQTAQAKEAIAGQTRRAHALLSAETQRILMRDVLKQIADKGAISLAYSKQDEGTSSEQER